MHHRSFDCFLQDRSKSQVRYRSDNLESKLKRKCLPPDTLYLAKNNQNFYGAFAHCFETRKNFCASIALYYIVCDSVKALCLGFAIVLLFQAVPHIDRPFLKVVQLGLFQAALLLQCQTLILAKKSHFQRLKAENLQKKLRSLGQFVRTVKGQNNF